MTTPVGRDIKYVSLNRKDLRSDPRRTPGRTLNSPKRRGPPAKTPQRKTNRKRLWQNEET